MFKDDSITKIAREFMLAWLDSRTDAKPQTPQKLSHRNKEIKMKSYQDLKDAVEIEASLKPNPSEYET